ncbi:hypothetical protein KKH23_02935, partial [Patescibacteria group bacterium]|nr:hypothetical protein [Patescibacteria group bacterium]
FSPISAIFLVGFTAYAIIKHRFLDIRLIIARSISYALLIITFSLIYAGGLFGLGTLITRSQGTTANSIVSAVLAIAIAFSFQPLRRFLEKITDKIFYKEKYDSNKLIYKLSLKMAENIQLDVLTGEILEILRDEMRISTASFLVITKKGLEYTIKDHNTFHSQPTKEELKLISEEGKILIFEELEKGKVKNVLRKHNLSVFTPLTTKGKRVGYLLLGEKSSGDIYYDQDIKTLSILASQFAISIQNAQSYEEITKFNKTLKQEVDKATLNLQVANKRLTELGKLKDEFFSIAAHELRTPLTAIQGNTSLIQEYFGDDIRKNKDLEEMVEDVNESSKRLIKIVNDYLDASRLEQGRIVFKNKNIDIKEIITDVVAETKELATEKNLYIKLGEEINAKLLQVFADKDRVKQVIYNLVGNAIKYTKQGGLTIHAQEENGSLLLRFEDTGIGIDPEGQQLLFQKFQQVGENHLDRKTNRGAGIGLYISKLLVESMGGKIYLEKSEVNKGSIFTFTLPLAKVAKTA